jgi:peptide/nickel transport system substrate-binding protein
MVGKGLRRSAVRAATTALAAVAFAALAYGAQAKPDARGSELATQPTLVVGVPDDAFTFDPLFATTPRSTQIIMNAYDPLMQYALKRLPNGLRIYNPARVSGLSLQSMRLKRDGRTWALTLRRGLRFPSGRPVTADSIVFTGKRNFGVKAGGGAFMYGVIAGIPGPTSFRKTGPNTLEVRTAQPNPLLPEIFVLSNSVPWDTGLIDANRTSKDPFATKWLARNTAGHGPYQLERWSPGSEIVLRANERYWRGAPSIKRVVIKIIPSAASRMVLLQRGNVDVVERLSAQEIQSVSRNRGVKIISVPSSNQVQLAMNVKSEPFDDVRVRRAIGYAVPYQDIMRSVYFSRARKAAGPIPVGFPGHTSRGYPYGRQNLERARSLLSAAGVSNLRLNLEIDTGNPDHEPTAVLIRSALAQLGITINIQKYTPAVFAERRQKRQLNFFLNESIWWVVDPSYALGLGYTCGSFFNYGNYCNKARVDNVLAKARGELNRAKRLRAFQAIHRQVVADMPVVWITQPNFNLAARRNIAGYTHFNDEMLRFYYLRKT